MSDKALVIGIGQYPTGIPALPAVSTDVREIAKLLGSEDGGFDQREVVVLADKQATRASVLKELETTCSSAARDQTTFIYLAGHGEPLGGQYYFLPVDVDEKDIPSTGISLSEIKGMFDASPCERLFLLLDFCHSGAILARSASAQPQEQVEKAVARALGVIKGAGRVIMCACTADQKAYEGEVHGFFTEHLLAGLKGGAVTDGEVTVNSLHDYIDRRMGSSRQRPMFYGTQSGRIVLMQTRGVSEAKSGKPVSNASEKKTVITDTGNLILLKDTFFSAKSARRDAEGKIIVEIATDDPEEEAILGGLKGKRYEQQTVSYAHRNTACFAHVKSVENESRTDKPVWTIQLQPEGERQGGFSFSDVSFQDESGHYTPDDVARLRARLLLLNEKLPMRSGSRSIGSFNMVENAVTGSNAKIPVKGDTLSKLYAQFGSNPERFLEFARLTLVFVLVATNTFENILELKLGPISEGKLHVKCRGQRRPIYSNKPAAALEIEGDYYLGKVEAKA